MIVYLAGGLSGNLQPFWNETLKIGWEKAMRIYLAGSETRQYVIDEAMKIFWAGNSPFANKEYNIKYDNPDIYILETFYSVNDSNKQWIKRWDKSKFLLDSGAFTFMSGTHKGKIDFEQYARKYCDFINEYGITQFFELDIDSVVGYDEVKRLRKIIERETGKQPIPVWHISRGKQDFIDIAKDYSYVAIGGIVTKEIDKSKYKYFPWFIDKAHENDAKIHGLGFTQLALLEKYHFDSVDSTAWTAGNRFGFIYKFTGYNIVKHDVPKGKRLKSRECAVNNFLEWCKFQKFAENNL